MFAHLTPESSDFGDSCALYPPSCTSSPCNLLFLNPGVYGLVQATVGVGTVLIWDFCVAYTRGGGYKPAYSLSLDGAPAAWFAQGSPAQKQRHNHNPKSQKNLLYLDCQHDAVHRTEHLRGTRESEQKNTHNPKTRVGCSSGERAPRHSGPLVVLNPPM